MTVDDNCLLASIDVNSLYTNIQQKRALSAVEWALGSTDIKLKQKEFLLKALDLAMSHNFFWHDKEYFRQVKGVAMGAKYAPSAVNLFMSFWESEAIYQTNIPELRLYKRYIDDIDNLGRITRIFF